MAKATGLSQAELEAILESIREANRLANRGKISEGVRRAIHEYYYPGMWESRIRREKGKTGKGPPGRRKKKKTA
jgi:hypothetical protein